jgi:hypothetical protein
MQQWREHRTVGDPGNGSKHARLITRAQRF